MKKILGLDLGTNSIGWAVINEVQIDDKTTCLTGIDCTGSRIIPMDAKILGDFDKGNSISQTAERTRLRNIRRLIERSHLRRSRLHRVLMEMDWLPLHYMQCLDRYGNFINYQEPNIAWKKEQDGKYKFLFTDSYSEMLQEFANQLNWRFVSQSQKIKFTEELVRKYEDKWFWSELMQNIKVQEDIPDFENIFANHRSVVTFTDRIKEYRSNPCIYHFTHFYNAIDVIRSRKILSRDRAEELGLLKYDSAGSVVFRSNKAHKFARFYFRPCTPTQYYNEALGADSQLGYYNWRGEWKRTFRTGFSENGR